VLHPQDEAWLHPGYTKITEGRRRMAQEEMQRRGL